MRMNLTARLRAAIFAPLVAIRAAREMKEEQ